MFWTWCRICASTRALCWGCWTGKPSVFRESPYQRNLAVYGLGGIVLPFAAIKLLDMGLTALGVA